jgi:hypothetical protein
MNPRAIRLPLLAAVLLLGAGQARAELIDFSYQWTVMPSAVIPGGTGTVTLSTAPDGAGQAELGSSTPTFIPGATVTTTSSATEPPDSFNTPLSMKLHLTDEKTGLSGDLSFSGTIAGQLTATSSTLTSTFDGPVTQELKLANRVYSVSIDPALVSLPAPGATSPGSIDARVSVASRGGPPFDPPGGGPPGGGPPGGGPPGGSPPIGAPEPSALLLGATAVLGLAARRVLCRRLPRQAA